MAYTSNSMRLIPGGYYTTAVSIYCVKALVHVPLVI